MIFYKYVSFDTGSRIIEGNAIGFSQPKYFNDPFDMPSYPEEEAPDPVSGIFAARRTMGKNYIWAEKTGILSLTRTPVNALMWAHYADSHQGLVIGIDAAVAGFTDENRNLIPVQYGSVIYVSRRQTAPFITKPRKGIAVGATHHFPADHYDKLQRVFLHKPLYWSYEEEVRVVKSLDGIDGEQADTQSGHFELDINRGRPLYLYTLPADSIRELYIGIKADNEAVEALADRAKARHPHLSGSAGAVPPPMGTRCLMRAPFRTNGEGSNSWLAARVLYRAPAFRQTRSIVFMPPIYDWSTSGTAIVPSACW